MLEQNLKNYVGVNNLYNIILKEGNLMENNRGQLVIVRGINSDWFKENFINMNVYFGGDPRGIPLEDSDFVGFYVEAPHSAITHVGVVETIEKHSDYVNYKLKAIIKLDNPIKPTVEHPIRKHEYWTLKQLGISKLSLLFNDFSKVGGDNI
jgi:hypothetical protein